MLSNLSLARASHKANLDSGVEKQTMLIIKEKGLRRNIFLPYITKGLVRVNVPRLHCIIQDPHWKSVHHRCFQ